MNHQWPSTLSEWMEWGDAVPSMEQLETIMSEARDIFTGEAVVVAPELVAPAPRTLFATMIEAQVDERTPIAGVRWMSETVAGRAERDRLWESWKASVAQRELPSASDVHASAAFMWWLVANCGVVTMPDADRELVGRAVVKLREMVIELCKAPPATPAMRMTEAVQVQQKMQALPKARQR